MRDVIKNPNAINKIQFLGNKTFTNNLQVKNNEFTNNTNKYVREDDIIIHNKIKNYFKETEKYIASLASNDFIDFISNQASNLSKFIELKNSKYLTPLNEANIEISKVKEKPIANLTENNKINSQNIKYWTVEEDYAIFYVYLYHNSNYKLLKNYIKDKSFSQMKYRLYNKIKLYKSSKRDLVKVKETFSEKIVKVFKVLSDELIKIKNLNSYEDLKNFIEKEIGINDCKYHQVFNKFEVVNILNDIKDHISD
jgi:hypothetical protein